ncbi:hyaluronan and proteoglycan link protein 1a [Corythoichthys intestinalis]|uniref:hyaluronan and proteoglycan link protein 1a n=1 Tax=Corythoichthys intestinalis TaxID=161448 RepID=UPI0025A638A2|nr:hyaluronan and proteoglycan link protein 1-like [Corythoichthys intestinalis]XP_061804706.1 hyaluronan and proteoglycan link protein 1-like [Nerophis lumbriciformis]
MTSLLCITIFSLTLACSAYSQPAGTPMPHSVKLFAELGGNVTLPCRLPHHSSSFFNVGIRVKWTKIAEDEALNEDVLLSMGFHKKTYGSFEDRVFLQEDDSDDASLVITDLSTDDSGTYRCEIINGMTDSIQETALEVQSDMTDGVVFPYSPPIGRYSFNFEEAVQACLDQDAVVATFEDLFQAWKAGLDWCNAGWLDDGTVQYPITKPREPCGGAENGPGLRSYGKRDKYLSRFDVFCYATPLKGNFYWLTQPERLNFDEAVQACHDDGAEIAKVGHMYAAWKLEGYDRCDAGWLADGSVRYPISRPRKNCSPTEAAVRFVGFPDKQEQLYGVYCFKPDA